MFEFKSPSTKGTPVTLTIAKGGTATLTKPGQKLETVRIGLGWDENPGNDEWDLDASALGLVNGRVMSNDWFVFYNQLQSPNNAIVHMGDNLTGGDEGTNDEDDEEIIVDLAALHPRIDTIAIAVSIHDAAARGQNFGQVRNAYIRVVNELTGNVILRYDLTDGASTEPSIVFGEIYKDKGNWNFRATGQGYPGNLLQIARKYGVDITA
jgi:tellurium resistance protein TerD